MIPRIIHQTAPRDSLTPAVLENVAHVRALHPGWDYCFYDDDEVVKVVRSFGPAVFGAFSRINPKYGAARADLFRYLLMYRFGGVYIDIKASMEQPLDAILRPDDEYLLAHWNNRRGEAYQGWGLHPELRAMPRGELQQWHVIARPEHPFLRNVVANVLANIARYSPDTHGVGKKGVLRTTGPIAYTRAIVPLMAEHPHRLFDTHAAMGLRYSIFEDESRFAHKALFKTHYSQLDEPVVLAAADE